MTTGKYRKLKPGDNVLVYGVVERVGEENVQVWVKHSNGDKTWVWVSMDDVGTAWAVPSNPPSSPVPCAAAYDPCRRFKKDDIVTPIERDGREVPDGAPVGEICTVVEPEKNGIVCIRYDAGSEHYIHEIPYFYLELVTPVEELEPYYVKDDGTHYVVGKRPEKPEIVYLAEYSKTLHPHAKEAAEAERDRLNAEHRKDANNGGIL